MTADEAVFAMKKGGGGAVGVRTLTVEVATYTEFRDGGGRGGETSRDFLRYIVAWIVSMQLWILCAMSSASGGLGRAKRRRKRGRVGAMC